MIDSIIIDSTITEDTAISDKFKIREQQCNLNSITNDLFCDVILTKCFVLTECFANRDNFE